MSVAGVDGVPGGWVVCVVADGHGAGPPGRGTGRPDRGNGVDRPDRGGDVGRSPRPAQPAVPAVTWSVVPDAAAVLEVTAGCDAVGVDIPLALPVGAGRREAEVLAAARLGSARSSLFPTPPAEVLAAPTYADACSVARRVTGKAISLQTFHIGPKIRDWQSVALPENVVEAHPEMSFRTLAPDVAFAGKKTARGAGQRVAALARWLDPAALLADLPATGTRIDDALDALVTAWSAARWARGEADELGPGRDRSGRRLQIVV